MRRLLWIVPLCIAIAVIGFMVARPRSAPADPARNSVEPTANQTPAAMALPITQVVLYSSGVGYFQRDGQVEGNTRVDLDFPVADVNDLLKSMVLQDLGGGHISAVGYDSHDPIAKTLDSFAIQLANNPSNSEILNQARGEKIEITVPGKYCGISDHTGSSNNLLVALQGTVVGVETKQPAGKDGTAFDPINLWKTDYLNLWCAEGMRSIPLNEIQRVKFLNPAVENEVNRALEVLARGHDTQKKAVSLQFDGNGKRPVRVGYVVETPLWRTSYRLLVDKEGKLFVQGWAMVANPTNEDWKDVRMSLISGRPISFKMDLYQPLYVPRPVVQPELHASIRPTTHDAAGISPTQVVGGGAPQYPYVTGSVVTTATTGIPSITNSGPSTPHVTPIASSREPVRSPRTVQDQLDENDITLRNGVTSAAKASDLGDNFQYAIEHAVSIPRQKSALLPIVNKEIEGDKVSLFSPNAHPKYPLLALRLKNTSGVHLMQGPVTVFEGTGYCGDAQLPDLQPNEDRLVSYALDLGTEVETTAGDSSRKELSVRLKKGILTTAIKVRDSKTYSLKNRSPHDRVVLVEHPCRDGFKLVSDTQPNEKTRGAYRFEVKVAAGETAQLKVAEEQDVDQQAQVVNFSTSSIRYYLGFEFSDENLKSAFEKLLEQQESMTKTQQDLNGFQQKLSAITQDQARLRANLKEMPETAAAYKRYLEKFDAQETQIEKLQAQIQETQERTVQQRSDCEAYFNSLDLEATIQKGPAN